MDVFAERGIAGAKLEDIAARAGVSKGTVYLYFTSKEDLFREVIRQLLVPSIAELERVTVDGTALEQVERYIRTHWSHFDRPHGADWLRLVLTELHKFPDLAEIYWEEVITKSNRVIGDVLLRGMETGEIRRTDPTATVSMIKSVVLMQALWRQTPRPPSNPAPLTSEQTIDSIVDFVLHALRPESPAAHKISTDS